MRGAGAGDHPHPQEAGAGRHRVQVRAGTKFVNRLGTGIVNIHNSPSSSSLILMTDVAPQFVVECDVSSYLYTNKYYK